MTSYRDLSSKYNIGDPSQGNADNIDSSSFTTSSSSYVDITAALATLPPSFDNNATANATSTSLSIVHTRSFTSDASHSKAIVGVQFRHVSGSSGTFRLSIDGTSVTDEITTQDGNLTDGFVLLTDTLSNGSHNLQLELKKVTGTQFDANNFFIFAYSLPNEESAVALIRARNTAIASSIPSLSSSIVQTTGARRCLLVFSAENDGAAAHTIKFQVDAGNIGSGFTYYQEAASSHSMLMVHLTDVLTAASHTFTVVGSGSGGNVSKGIFSVIELPNNGASGALAYDRKEQASYSVIASIFTLITGLTSTQTIEANSRVLLSCTMELDPNSVDAQAIFVVDGSTQLPNVSHFLANHTNRLIKTLLAITSQLTGGSHTFEVRAKKPSVGTPPVSSYFFETTDASSSQDVIQFNLTPNYSSVRFLLLAVINWSGTSGFGTMSFEVDNTATGTTSSGGIRITAATNLQGHFSLTAPLAAVSHKFELIGNGSAYKSATLAALEILVADDGGSLSTAQTTVAGPIAVSASSESSLASVAFTPRTGRVLLLAKCQTSSGFGPPFPASYLKFYHGGTLIASTDATTVGAGMNLTNGCLSAYGYYGSVATGSSVTFEVKARTDDAATTISDIEFVAIELPSLLNGVVPAISEATELPFNGGTTSTSFVQLTGSSINITVANNSKILLLSTVFITHSGGPNPTTIITIREGGTSVYSEDLSADTDLQIVPLLSFLTGAKTAGTYTYDLAIRENDGDNNAYFTDGRLIAIEIPNYGNGEPSATVTNASMSLVEIPSDLLGDTTEITLTTETNKALIGFNAPMNPNGGQVDFRFLVDGTQVKEFLGFTTMTAGQYHFSYMTDALTSGVHTFKVQVKAVASQSITLNSGHFWVEELS